MARERTIPGTSLHVKQGVAVAALLLACRREPPPPPPPPTPVAPRVVDAGAVSEAVDVPVMVDVPAVTVSGRWAMAYSSEALDGATRAALAAEAVSTDTDRAPEAAFVLGRRLPVEDLLTVAATLPRQSLVAFARGVVGRAPPSAPREVGRFRELLRAADGLPVVAEIVSRFRLPLAVEDLPLVERFLASSDLTEQCAGARLLDAPNAPMPSPLVLAGLHPVALALASRALHRRNAVPSALWTTTLDHVSARALANPRAWGNALLALVDAVPSADPFVRERVIALPEAMNPVALEPASVAAAFRCAIARRADALDNADRTSRCATGPERWRSVIARVERLGDAPTPELLTALLNEAPDDLRVQAAIAQRLVTLTPGAARPLLIRFAQSNDPGVLAAFLESLALHVQHARAIPPAARTALLQRPFELPEPVSLEARLQSIRVQRALGMSPTVPASAVRAIRAEANPDAAVTPATVSGEEAIAARIRLETTAGTFVVAFDPHTAPAAVRTMVEAARAHTYDGTPFHRVVPGFVAQGGDPRGDGYGGVSAITPTELSGATFDRGSVGVALAGLDTGGSGFFVVLADTPHLDGQYPFVGRVIEGMSSVDRLMVGDTIIRATVE